MPASLWEAGVHPAVVPGCRRSASGAREQSRPAAFYGPLPHCWSAVNLPGLRQLTTAHPTPTHQCSVCLMLSLQLQATS